MTFGHGSRDGAARKEQRKRRSVDVKEDMERRRQGIG